MPHHFLYYFLQDLYGKYKYLWADDRSEQIEAFVATQPLTADIRERFIEYDRITEEIKEEPNEIKIGALDILMGII